MLAFALGNSAWFIFFGITAFLLVFLAMGTLIKNPQWFSEKKNKLEKQKELEVPPFIEVASGQTFRGETRQSKIETAEFQFEEDEEPFPNYKIGETETPPIYSFGEQNFKNR